MVWSDPTCLGWTPADWRTWFSTRGRPGFRGDQVFTWIHRFGVTDPSAMTNLSKDLREELARELVWSGPLSVERVQRSFDGSIKFGFGTADGHLIESVLIPGSGRDRRKYTVCVSSQIGCALGCTFCATATMGFLRDLSASEIVAQIHEILRFMAAEPDGWDLGERPRTQWLTNIVYMGMGEPLLNLPAVLQSVAVLSDPAGLDFSSRRITISTAGWVPGLRELAGHPDFAGQLAISLHACDDGIRTRLMPVNRRFPLADLREALLEFPLPARRRITMEYILLADVNDSPAHARALVRFCSGLRVKINLIPYHAYGPASQFSASPPTRKAAFTELLQASGLTVIERSSAGADIDAACGQLASSERSREPQ
ncbi:23S rRNA (adenine(2503)-C(2))-methyltransferase RlmN [Myxococcota bacterium]|nr:23S rRNA (adenine(2503)-C(2))-methyltransferase RlmN [Myxococcota bacterium]